MASQYLFELDLDITGHDKMAELFFFSLFIVKLSLEKASAIDIMQILCTTFGMNASVMQVI